MEGNHVRKIKFNLQYCYGIKKLHQELEFKNRTFAIYAPNGVMKTSFAKTMQDLSKDLKPTDLAFPDRETVYEIFVDAIQVKPKNIFVVESYNKDYKSEKISTLLANSELKKEYEEIHKKINKSSDSLIKKLKQLSGLSAKKDSIEKTIENIFDEPFLDCLLNLEATLKDAESLPFHNIEYQIIYNDEVKKFLQTKDFKQSLKNYIDKYYELIDKSPYLGKEFKFHDAENVQKQLSSNNFYKVGHSINLFDGEKKEVCSTDEEFRLILQKEKEKIFSNKELQDKFDEISSKLSNKDLKKFRDYLLEHKDIIPEFYDMENFSKRLWKSYLVNQKSLFLDLVTKYKEGQESIKGLLSKAKEEKTDWEEVIRIFNTRFSHLPFQLIIKNKEDVILKSEIETIEFIFKDGSEQKMFDSKDELLKILSTGEQRALYILNVIFEMEARKKDNSETLFIIDDIADSFDYKNKYAIIEYLKHISEFDKFYMIILTHNFDFYRTIESRGISNYSQCLIAMKNDDGIRLEKIQYLKNPFINNWKKNLSDHKKLIASIPFVRNLIEYTQGESNEDYNFLTEILHYKQNSTENKTIDSLKCVFEKYISGIEFPALNENMIIDLIYSTADECLTSDEGINLENKIVLSIAIRIKSEHFMSSKVTDAKFLTSLSSELNQYWKLLRKFEDEFNNEEELIDILKRVNLITPENIHVNSFMYEPILDMGDGELRELYKTVKEKLK